MKNMRAHSVWQTAKTKTRFNCDTGSGCFPLSRQRKVNATATPVRKLRLRHDETLWKKGLRAVVPCNVRKGARSRFFSNFNKPSRQKVATPDPASGTRSLTTTTLHASKLTAEAHAFSEVCDRAFSNEDFAASIVWVPHSLVQFRSTAAFQRSEMPQQHRYGDDVTQNMRNMPGFGDDNYRNGRLESLVSEQRVSSAPKLSVRGSADFFRAERKSKGRCNTPANHLGPRFETSREQMGQLSQTYGKSLPMTIAHNPQATESIDNTTFKRDAISREFLGSNHVAEAVSHHEAKPHRNRCERCLLPKRKPVGSQRASLATSFSSSFVLVETDLELCEKAGFGGMPGLKNMQYPIIPQRISSMQPYKPAPIQREGTIRGQVPFRLRQTSAIKASPHLSIYGELSSTISDDRHRRHTSTISQDKGQQPPQPSPPPPSPSLSSLHPSSSQYNSMLEFPRFQQSLSYSKIAVMYNAGQSHSESASQRSLQQKFDTRVRPDELRPCAPNFSRRPKAWAPRSKMAMTPVAEKHHHHQQQQQQQQQMERTVSQKTLPTIERDDGGKSVDRLPRASSLSVQQVSRNRRQALPTEMQKHATNDAVSNVGFDARLDSPTLPEEQGLTSLSPAAAMVSSAHWPPKP